MKVVMGTGAESSIPVHSFSTEWRLLVFAYPSVSSSTVLQTIPCKTALVGLLSTHTLIPSTRLPLPKK